MSKVHEIKRAKKASLLLKTISQLFYEIVRDDNRLQSLSLTRIELSPEKSSCHVFFYTDKQEEGFRELLSILILYKPSIRSAISKLIAGRYTPELFFKFDTVFEKTARLENIMNRLKENGQL